VRRNDNPLAASRRANRVSCAFPAVGQGHNFQLRRGQGQLQTPRNGRTYIACTYRAFEFIWRNQDAHGDSFALSVELQTATGGICDVSSICRHC
jgi:hypothetical protein